jgi:hypothetical protein
MKKIFSLCLLLLCTSAFAQIQITSSFAPVPGNSFLSHEADTTNINPGNSGANQVWNFSSLVELGDSSYAGFVSPASTPNSSSYPGATVASGISDPAVGSIYTYFQATGSSLSVLGTVATSTQTLNIPLNDPLIIQVYPFNYGNTNSDSYSGSGSYGMGSIKRRGTITNTYDAYGTLILPSGTVNNTARIKTIQTVTDSTFIGVNYISSISTTTTTYQWVKQNYKFPLMEISITTTTNYPSGTTSTYKYVSFVKNGTTIGIANNNATVVEGYKLHNNYPNPFNPSTQIRFSIPKNEFVSLRIYNSLGKEAAELISQNLSAGDYTYFFDASELSSGTYFYTLASGNFTETKRMVLVK